MVNIFTQNTWLNSFLYLVGLVSYNMKLQIFHKPLSHISLCLSLGFCFSFHTGVYFETALIANTPIAESSEYISKCKQSLASGQDKRAGVGFTISPQTNQLDRI